VFSMAGRLVWPPISWESGKVLRNYAFRGAMSL
jgi:hypothetical protein